MYNQYSSVYAKHIEQYVEMKRRLGFKFITGTVILSLFDHLAQKNGETAKGITRELAEQWCKRKPNESERYRYDRVRMIGQFSMFLRDLGINSFVFKVPPVPKCTFIPYIYS